MRVPCNTKGFISRRFPLYNKVILGKFCLTLRFKILFCLGDMKIEIGLKVWIKQEFFHIGDRQFRNRGL